MNVLGSVSASDALAAMRAGQAKSASFIESSMTQAEGNTWTDGLKSLFSILGTPRTPSILNQPAPAAPRDNTASIAIAALAAVAAVALLK